ncbi:MAG: hypothetical protein M4579_000104 [Chaenotheca gracillima]|nr:MAG: hypothetical protein M4579_000104 [Chaenotheca gracillima]
MSNRYSHNPGEDRYTPRDRSPPPRGPERPPSTTFGASTGSRPSDSSTPASNPNLSRDAPSRDPPKGPKALVEAPKGPGLGSGSFVPAGPRGRGFPSRGDSLERSRDRDSRDAREPAPFRSERDRERGFRDRDFERERRLSPPIRSRTPPLRDPRSSREFPRDVDVVRARRGSRDGPLSAGSTSSDAPAPSGPPLARGGLGRGRGRGEWEFRGRGRGIYDDRDRFGPRSRSRERRWERDDRDRDRDPERREDRREESKRVEREEREREAEKWKKGLVGSVDTRPFSGSLTTPSTPHPSGTTSPRQTIGETAWESASGRRASSSAISATNREPRREGENYFPSRTDSSRDRAGSRQSSPPPQAPQVPAFGSLSYRTSPVSAGPGNSWRASSPSKAAATSTTLPSIPQGPKNAPTGPKALLSGQPPTGPRAERIPDKSGPASTIAIKADLGREKDVQNQSAQYSPTLSTKSLGDSSAVQSSSIPQTFDSSLPPPTKPRQPPTGPQSSLSRPGSSSGFAVGRGAPPPIGGGARGGSPVHPPAPNQASQTSPAKPAIFTPSGNLGANIPTGPKADRGPRGRGSQWGRGGFAFAAGRVAPGQGPVPAKRDYHGEERDQMLGYKSNIGDQSSSLHPFPATSRISGTENTLLRGKDGASSLAHREGIVKQETLTDDVDMSGVPRPEEEVRARSAAEVESPRQNSFEVDVIDEDEDTIDEEETLEEYKSRTFQKMASIEEKVQRTSSAIAEELNLWLQINAVIEQRGNELADDLPLSRASANEASPRPDEASVLRQAEAHDAQMTEADNILREVSSNRIKTPPLESLPFLSFVPLPPIEDLEITNENRTTHQKLKDILIKDIARRQRDVRRHNEGLKASFVDIYRSWRAQVQKLDEERKRKAAIEAERTSAANAADLAATLSTQVEGRRGGKNISEYEYQRVLAQSEQDAKLAEEKALEEEQAMLDIFDNEKEAVTPNMLDPESRKISIFKDANQLIDERMSFGVFNFLPPPDDFTAEEHKVFLENYLAFPKKWGKIAEGLPDRTYQQCIQHYYSTKVEAKYKQKELKRNSKRGKGRRAGPQTRPKSNALMSGAGVQPDLYDGEEFEAPPVAVTDSGRPRRAAAPVFGDASGDGESSTPAPTPGRKPLNTPKADAGGENPMEKGPKRNKAGGPRERGQKRGKNQPLAAAPAAPSTTVSPQKPEKTKEKEVVKERELKAEDVEKMKDLEGAQLLADLQSGLTVPMDVPAPILGERPSVSYPAGSPSRTSSYWSVPECNEFPKLLDYYGTDWPNIAAHMTSKTSIMVKNFYKREVETHKKFDLRDRAILANQRIDAGLSRGPPPPQTLLPKRRYETPQPTGPRPLAPSIEPGDEAVSPLMQPSSTGLVPGVQPGQATRFPPLAQAASAMKGPESVSVANSAGMPRLAVSSQPQPVDQLRPQHQPPVSQPQGPPLGFFTDNRPEVRPIISAQQIGPHSQPQPKPRQTFQAPVQQLQQQQEQPQTQRHQHHTQPPPPSRYQTQPQARANAPEMPIASPPHQAHPNHSGRSSSGEAVRKEAQHSQRTLDHKIANSWDDPAYPGYLAQIQLLDRENQRRIEENKRREEEQQQQQQHQQQEQQQIEHRDHRQRQEYQADILSRRPEPLVRPDSMPAVARQRADSGGPRRSLGTPAGSPVSGRPPLSVSVPNEEFRPSSTLSQPSGSPAPLRAQETTRKTSNIMALLNATETEEPKPRSKRVDQISAVSSTPPPQGHGYQPPPQAPQSQSRRDPIAESSSSHAAYHRQPASGSYSSSSQPGRRSATEMPESSTPASSATSTWYPRPPYPSQAQSPQPQSVYSEPSRPNYQPLRTSSPPVHYAHSRASSYSDRPPSLLSQQPPLAQSPQAPQHQPPQAHQYPPQPQQQPPSAPSSAHPLSQAQPQQQHSHYQSPLSAHPHAQQPPQSIQSQPQTPSRYHPHQQQHMMPSYSGHQQPQQQQPPPPQPPPAISQQPPASSMQHPQRSYTPTQYHSGMHRLSGGPYDPPPHGATHGPPPPPPPIHHQQQQHGHGHSRGYEGHERR